MGKTFGCEHCFAAASATITNEVHPISVVFTKLYEVVFIGLLEQLFALDSIDPAGMAMAYKRGCRGIKRHADIHRCAARLIKVLHFVSAITEADPHRFSRFDYLASPLIIENMKRLLIRQSWFMDKPLPSWVSPFVNRSRIKSSSTLRY